jgi:hypothetical protein
MAVNEEDKDIESVAQPGAESEKSIEDLELRSLIRAKNRDYERLKELENDGKIGVDGGNALKDQVGNKKNGDGGGEKKEGGFRQFVSSVGDALTGFTEGIDKKMESVYDDREKRTRFLQGLNTIIEASSYKPIGQATSEFGMIAKGQKKGFLESEAIGQKRKATEASKLKAQASLEKALRGEAPRFRDDISEAILKEYPNFQTRMRDKKTQYGALDQRYTELYKLAQKGFEAPTGLVSEFLTPFEKIFSELDLTDKYNKLKENVSGYEKGQDLSAEDKVAFKDLFSAATKQAIVSQVKDLYPASDKDIQVLLSTIGDIGTNPQALRKLVAAQKAMMEINNKIPNFAKEEAFINKNIEFEQVANEKAAQALADELKDKVTEESLVELFGTAEDANPFRIINAYYYQELAPQFKGGTTNYFDTYKKTQEAQEQNIQDLIQNKVTDELINGNK